MGESSGYRADPQALPQNRARAALQYVRRAFERFLTLPSLVLCGFVLLALGIYLADDALWRDLGRNASHAWLVRLIGNQGSDSSLLSSVATGLITVTSITFSMLLIALQQSASSLTNQVYDLFLQRKSNQFFFGYFVGLSIFALFNVATVSEVHLPILGTILTLILAVVALSMVPVLTYITVAQMQPAAVVHAICQRVLKARARQRDLLAGTCRNPSPNLHHARSVPAWETGYVHSIRLSVLQEALSALPGIQIDLQVVIGTHVAWGEPLAKLRSAAPLTDQAVAALSRAVRNAVVVTSDRLLLYDADFGITQLVTVAWTSTSTAKSNPASTAITLHGLRDILLRWSDEDTPESRSAAVVYRDQLLERTLDTLEDLLVVASESLQAQTLAEIYEVMATTVRRLPRERQRQVEAIVVASTTALGEHVPTHTLTKSGFALVAALREVGCCEGACALRSNLEALCSLRGQLASRGNRASKADGSRG